jgi:hypothetical protein
MANAPPSTAKALIGMLTDGLQRDRDDAQNELIDELFDVGDGVRLDAGVKVARRRWIPSSGSAKAAYISSARLSASPTSRLPRS